MSDKRWVVLLLGLIIASSLMLIMSYGILTKTSTNISMAYKVLFIVVDIILLILIGIMIYK